MIFKIQTISGKCISNYSILPGESEVILSPHINSIITNVIDEPKKPLFLEMDELPVAKSFKIILWVDDKPQNNREIMQKIEMEYPYISILICLSTQIALEIFLNYEWLLKMGDQNILIISNMGRLENQQMNYMAGVELYSCLRGLNYKEQIMIYSNDIAQAQKNFENKGIQEGNFEITNELNDILNFVKEHSL